MSGFGVKDCGLAKTSWCKKELGKVQGLTQGRNQQHFPQQAALQAAAHLVQALRH
jgi:hypothetical protein